MYQKDEPTDGPTDGPTDEQSTMSGFMTGVLSGVVIVAGRRRRVESSCSPGFMTDLTGNDDGHVESGI